MVKELRETIGDTTRAWSLRGRGWRIQCNSFGGWSPRGRRWWRIQCNSFGGWSLRGRLFARGLFGFCQNSLRGRGWRIQCNSFGGWSLRGRLFARGLFGFCQNRDTKPLSGISQNGIISPIIGHRIICQPLNSQLLLFSGTVRPPCVFPLRTCSVGTSNRSPTSDNVDESSMSYSPSSHGVEFSSCQRYFDVRTVVNQCCHSIFVHGSFVQRAISQQAGFLSWVFCWCCTPKECMMMS